jgi:predicted TIM-barrel fold metal-dependent hydrolase
MKKLPLKVSGYLLLILFVGHSLCYGQQQDVKAEGLKLSEHRPVSLHKSSGASPTQARFPLIDLHSHAYPKSEDDLDRWVETMDALNIDKSVILTYTTGPAFDSLYQFFQKYPDRFVLFCGIDYSGYNEPGFAEKAIRELERCYRVGARGVGELGDKGKGLFYSKPTPAYGMHIDDARLDPVIKKCGELGMPISVHVAEPIWMYQPMDAQNDGLMNAYKWRLDDQEGILGHAEMVKTLENAVKKHPETTFIACHYANSSYDLEILGTLFDQYPNLYADISARFAETAVIPRTVNRFFTRYADRLVYGSDMGMDKDMYLTTFRILETEDEHFYDHNISSYHWAMNGYGLSPQVLEKVYRNNALKILGED